MLNVDFGSLNVMIFSITLELAAIFCALLRIAKVLDK